MSFLTIHEYTNKESVQADWLSLIDGSNNGTLFHRLEFLAYHGARFRDVERYLIWRKGGSVIAGIPFGIFVENGRRIVRSPFGASWGGFVHPMRLSLKYATYIVQSFLDYLRDNCIDECSITVPPRCYYRKSTNVIEFSMFSSGFQMSRREITHVLQLQENADILQLLDGKCRNQSRKALDVFSIHEDVAAEEFYPILLADKKRHFNAVPTHTLQDMKYLQSELLGRVTMDVALHPSGAKAGICYFHSHPDCLTIFYLAQESACLGLNGLNALIVTGLQKAAKKGIRYIDFGCTSLDSKVLNPGVAEFKEGFGAVGMFRDTFRIIL